MHCFVWLLRRCCTVRHLGVLLHGCLFGDFRGRSSKWGREDTCTRAGVFPNLAGSNLGGIRVGVCAWHASVPRHAAPCCSPMGLWVGPSVLFFFMLSGARLAPIWRQACLVGLCADWVACNRLGWVLLYVMRVSGGRAACVGRLRAWAPNC